MIDMQAQAPCRKPVVFTCVLDLTRGRLPCRASSGTQTTAGMASLHRGRTTFWLIVQILILPPACLRNSDHGPRQFQQHGARICVHYV
jgi:hypothetical protein